MPAHTGSRRARNASHSPINLIRGYVDAHINRHGKAKAASGLCVSRHITSCFLERGHPGPVAHHASALGPHA